LRLCAEARIVNRQADNQVALVQAYIEDVAPFDAPTRREALAALEALADANERLSEQRTADAIAYVTAATDRALELERAVAEAAALREALTEIALMRERWDLAESSDDLDFTAWFWEAVTQAEAALASGREPA
jgi:uncharacterized protein YigA (DUF484 family)